MRFQYRRAMSVAISLAALIVMMAANPPPAQAAAKFYVDNNLPLCKANAYPTIQEAVTAARPGPATITVCPGTYTGQVLIADMNKLKLIAKTGVVLTPGNIDIFSVHMLYVVDSTDVTVQGFTIDGLGHIGSGEWAAIYFFRSTGKIAKNTIANWHTASYPNSRNATGIGVYGVSGEKVAVERNSIANVDLNGIMVNGPATVKLTGNTLKATLPAGGSVYGISMYNIANSVIKGNKISGDAFPPGTGYMGGIVANRCSNITISGNTVTGTTTAVSLQTTSISITKITVKGNKLLEVQNGVFAIVVSSSVDLTMTNLKITGNKITNTLAVGNIGIDVNAMSIGSATGYVQDALVRGNKITHFTTGVENTPEPGGVITGVFGPNTVKP